MQSYKVIITFMVPLQDQEMAFGIHKIFTAKKRLLNYITFTVRYITFMLRSTEISNAGNATKNIVFFFAAEVNWSLLGLRAPLGPFVVFQRGTFWSRFKKGEPIALLTFWREPVALCVNT